MAWWNGVGVIIQVDETAFEDSEDRKTFLCILWSERKTALPLNSERIPVIHLIKHLAQMRCLINGQEQSP